MADGHKTDRHTDRMLAQQIKIAADSSFPSTLNRSIYHILRNVEQVKET